MAKVTLVGYSGHAYVVADIGKLLQHEYTGYIEKELKSVNPFNLPYLGSESDEAVLKKWALPGHYYALAVGDNRIRARLDQLLSAFPWEALTLIHPLAVVSSHAGIAAGTVISAGAIVNPLATVGRGCIINTGSIVEHECVLGKYVHIAPGAALGGNVSIGDGAFLGINSTVRQGIHIGADAFVGAGSVVIRDIPANEKWVGNPARPIR